MFPTHVERLERLTELLAEWQWLWAPAPFMHRQSPWQQHVSRYGWVAHLAECLTELDDETCMRLQDDPFDDSPLAAWLPVSELAELVAVPNGVESERLSAIMEAPSRWADHVGGRKWQQMAAFAAHMLPPGLQPGLQPMVEWCAGKGHLARLLSRLHGVEVTGLEWQRVLCDEGQRLADRQGVAVQLSCQDVMQDDVVTWLEGRSVVALHACGDLHVRLLELARQHATTVTLAPCCYQRTRYTDYRPLSHLAREETTRQGLCLSREHLALSVQETVTASHGERRKRERASAWRLGFDELQREISGIDEYLPIPSLSHGRLPQDFAGFCHWAADQKHVALTPSIDWSAFEAQGWERLSRVRRWELVRHLFRRPLEMWLVLDRVVWLEEAGFDVELCEFCERHLTPRNLLIRARPVVDPSLGH
ncbi:methyltransferase [Halomonas binhaiensis]|uniref:Methyltransferase n=2 Tax=Halomonas binhaiensis TaxID=2562282 RepID=A0A5C1NMA6_9GAMM|nr:methyltransferase [Halomonas binhaiensis]